MHSAAAFRAAVSSCRKSSRMERLYFAHKLGGIAVKLGIRPGGNREAVASSHKSVRRLPRLFQPTALLISDDEVGKTKPGIAGVIGLEGGDGVLGSA
jgi:hypothetical protein